MLAGKATGRCDIRRPTYAHTGNEFNRRVEKQGEGNGKAEFAYDGFNDGGETSGSNNDARIIVYQDSGRAKSV